MRALLLVFLLGSFFTGFGRGPSDAPDYRAPGVQIALGLFSAKGSAANAPGSGIATPFLGEVGIALYPANYLDTTWAWPIPYQPATVPYPVRRKGNEQFGRARGL